VNVELDKNVVGEREIGDWEGGHRGVGELEGTGEGKMDGWMDWRRARR